MRIFNKPISSFLLLAAIFMAHMMPLQAQEEQTKEPEKPVYVTGVVYDVETMHPLPQAIFKKNNKQIAATDDQGRFSFWGNKGDSLTYRFVGYKSVETVIPDTLKSSHYLMGIFMSRDTVELAEVIIFPRSFDLLTEMKQVPPQEQKMLQNAQRNVSNAARQGLTSPVKKFDAEMNAKTTMKTHQMRAEYKGLQITPENSVGLHYSTVNPNVFLYGTAPMNESRIKASMITENEALLIRSRYEAFLAKKWKQYDEKNKNNPLDAGN